MVAHVRTVVVSQDDRRELLGRGQLGHRDGQQVLVPVEVGLLVEVVADVRGVG